MPAEDFEDDYFDTDESRDRDFLIAIYSTIWWIISIPGMFIFMWIMCGIMPAVWATLFLITIYIVFIIIETRGS